MAITAVDLRAACDKYNLRVAELQQALNLTQGDLLLAVGYVKARALPAVSGDRHQWNLNQARSFKEAELRRTAAQSGKQTRIGRPRPIRRGKTARAIARSRVCSSTGRAAGS